MVCHLGGKLAHQAIHHVAIAYLFLFVLFQPIAYLAGKQLCLRHSIAAPGAMIGASNFFELSVAAAITLFGASSPAVLATIFGVLVEVPVMLAPVNFANRTAAWFPTDPRLAPSAASATTSRSLSPDQATAQD